MGVICENELRIIFRNKPKVIISGNFAIYASNLVLCLKTFLVAMLPTGVRLVNFNCHYNSDIILSFVCYCLG